MEFFKIFMALLVLLNPLSAMPIFISLTPNAGDAERRQIAKVASWSIAIVLILFTLIGQYILAILGISIGSFQVAGGIFIMLIALAMMNAKNVPSKNTKQERDEAGYKTNIAVVPLAIPLMTGPGVLSTVIIYSSTSKSWLETGYLLLASLLIALVSYAALRAAAPLSRMLGQTGINIVNRVMGMLIAALAVEIFVDGISRLFPQLAH